jgi:hypothetical protein
MAPKAPSIAVFNSVSWPRSGWVEADLLAGQRILDPDTQKPVPMRVIAKETGPPLPGFGAALVRVEFQASQIPGMGYKLFPVSGGALSSQPESERLDTNIVENQFYRITLAPDSGAIASIWDKSLNRELVDRTSSYRMGSYVYVTGGDNIPNNSLYRYGAGLPLPVLIPHAASDGRVVSVTRDARGITAVIESSAPNTPSIQTVITLPFNAKRIDLRISLHKEPTLKKEAAYIAFPFAVPEAHFGYDTQNGWVDPARDELLGCSREWYAVQRWASIHDPQVSTAVLPLDVPMVTFGDIVRGTWPKEFRPGSSTIFSWLMSNYWNTNFAPFQGGDFTFRYVILSEAKFDAQNLTRAGWETLTPLESDPVAAGAGQSGADLLASASFISLNAPDVVVSTWRLTQDGAGSILRLEEIAGKPARVSVVLPHEELVKAWRCSIVEKCEDQMQLDDGKLAFNIGPWQILTLRLQTRPAVRKTGEP